jgi:serine/threonine protein kinase
VRRIGRYELVERLGTGGMAEVWKARILDDAAASPVVLKRVPPHLPDDGSFVRSLRMEARALLNLQHPGIVRLIELVESEGRPVLVLEYVDGCDLRRLLANPSDAAPRHPGFGAYVVCELCRALGHAHSIIDERGVARPILHRDVSPANIMLTRDGAVKLVDFGIAKVLVDVDEVTRSQAIKGKLSYMAPEQLHGLELGPPADVYAAGLVLYECLTGRRLYTSAKTVSAMLMLRNAPLPMPSRLNGAVPAELDQIFATALAPRPSDRLADGNALADALLDVVSRLGYDRTHLCEEIARVVARSPELTVETSPALTRTAAKQPTAVVTEKTVVANRSAVSAAPTVARPVRSNVPALVGGLVAISVVALTLWAAHRPERLSAAPVALPPVARSPVAPSPVTPPTVTAPPLTQVAPVATPPAASSRNAAGCAEASSPARQATRLAHTKKRRVQAPTRRPTRLLDGELVPPY